MTAIPCRAAAFKALVEAAAKAIKADAGNRYSLEAPFPLPPVSCDWVPADRTFDHELLTIAPAADVPGFVSITIKAFRSTRGRNVFDGASFAPDRPFGERAVLVAALVHDVLYCVKGELAAWAGVKECKVRDFADTLFREMLLLLCKRKWIAHVYFIGVRLGFPAFAVWKRLARSLALAVAVLGVTLGGAGCGCQSLRPDPDNGHFIEGTSAADIPEPAIVKEVAP